MISLVLGCTGLLCTGLGVLGFFLYATDDASEDGAEDLWGSPSETLYTPDVLVDDLRSSYPPWEDALNHRVPGSYESSRRR